MRPEPSSPPPLTPRASDYLEQIRHYTLITPLFGGGAKAGEIDKDFPINGKTIRGHLRFWWRATQGGTYSNLNDLKKTEDAIFGTSTTVKEGKAYNPIRPLVLKIGVGQAQTKVFSSWLSETLDTNGVRRSKRPNNNDPKALEVWEKQEALWKRYDGSIKYAGFPLQEQRRERVPEKSVAANQGFQLTLNYHKDYQVDLEAALWAWETFGGVGGRTRRGFGALNLTKIEGGNTNTTQRLLPPKSEQLKTWLLERVKEFVSTGITPDEVPHLSLLLHDPTEWPKWLVIKTKQDNALSAWVSVLEPYRSFRQLRPERTANDFGQSVWPEPDSIRHKTNSALFGKFKDKDPARATIHTANDHRKLKPPVTGFPRAAFGLPIIFQFPHRYGEGIETQRYGEGIETQRKDFDKDPSQTTLKGREKGFERLGSPILLRPLACCDGKYVGIALRLACNGNIKPLDNLVLEISERSQPPVTWQLSPSQFDQIQSARDAVAGVYPKIPDAKLKGQTDILEAFLNYLKEQP